MKNYWKTFIAALAALPLLAAQALAKLEINVDLSSQRMNVTVDGQHYATWVISSGRRGYYTPRGTWRPKWLKRMHYSRKYDNAPMPWSIFYYGGYAIHGTNAVSRLGRPASHGCIRLHPANAARLFELVKRHGRKNTIIRVRGSTDVAYARIRKARLAPAACARRAWPICARRRAPPAALHCAAPTGRNSDAGRRLSISCRSMARGSCAEWSGSGRRTRPPGAAHSHALQAPIGV